MYKHYKVHSVFMFNTRMWGVHEYKNEKFVQTFAAESFEHAWKIVNEKLEGSQQVPLQGNLC